MGLYKEFRRNGKVSTQVGVAKVKKVLHKKNPHDNLYKIECLVGRGAKDGVTLHVDHIKPASLFPELYYDLDSRETLCEGCNLGKSGTDSLDWRGE